MQHSFKNGRWHLGLHQGKHRKHLGGMHRASLILLGRNTRCGHGVLLGPQRAQHFAKQAEDINVIGAGAVSAAGTMGHAATKPVSMCNRTDSRRRARRSCTQCTRRLVGSMGAAGPDVARHQACRHEALHQGLEYFGESLQ
ncbi:MAG: hypothetical protein DDT26_02477 [Dehalococcoidia bacterium]|nr:hypothetical protein [Chloroflexota bacterium]